MSVLCICVGVSLSLGVPVALRVGVSSVSECVALYCVPVFCFLHTGHASVCWTLYVLLHCHLRVFLGIICVPPGSVLVPVSHRCSVQLATPGTTVRMMWTSAPPSPARTGASALTSWPAISAPAPRERWVRRGRGWGTGWEAGSPSLPDGSLIFPSPQGVLCEINEDDCGPGPPLDQGPRCLHNGTCVDLVGGFRCTCPPGYTGLRCEADINECHPGACHDAHTRDCLQDPGGGFRCLCHGGFTGKRGRGGCPGIRPLFLHCG